MTLSGNGRKAFDDARPRLGVVGLGYWGPNLLRALIDAAEARVTWLCDLDSERLARFAKRYPAIEPTQSIDALLEDPDLDGILIATPVVSHFELASRSLRAGKHTFVEKPLTTSSAEAVQLLEIAEASGLALMCGHTFLYSPPVQLVKEILDSGDLGDLYYISSSRVNLGPYRSDVSVLSDLGPHDFSILRYWLEEMPEWISATGRDAIVDGNPDVAFVTLKFPSEVVAHLEMSWLAPSKLRRTVLVGSKKMVVYEDGTPEAVRIFDRGITFKDPETFGEFQLSYRTGDVVSPKLEATEPIVTQLADFVDAVRTGRPKPGHAQLCADVVRLLESSDVSLRTGGFPVSLDGERIEDAPALA